MPASRNPKLKSESPADALLSLMNDLNTPSKFALCMLVMTVLSLFGTEHLVFTLFGAVVYALLQSRMADKVDNRFDKFQNKVKEASLGLPGRSKGMKQPPPEPAEPRRQCITKTETKMPVSAPTFQSQEWHDEVNELLVRLLPTEQAQKVVTQIVTSARKAVNPVLPEAVITAFAIGDPMERGSFGVAIPEVDLVVNCSPEVLWNRLQSRLRSSNMGPTTRFNSRWKLRKIGVRVCTEVLVKEGFKFRRSAFTGADPKVTLLAATELCGAEKPIPIDVSVNNTTPLRNAGLMAVTVSLDSRVLELAVLVKRWAKDRGIAYAAQGHLPPYVWNILAIFFLQAKKFDDVSLLPPLDQFDWSACPRGLKRPPDVKKEQAPEQSVFPPRNHAGCDTPALFKEFFIFYRSTINWQTEAVSLQKGQRGGIPAGVPVHEPIPVDDEAERCKDFEIGKQRKALTVIDPWDPTQNISSDMTYFGLCRMEEELGRACELCEQGASLSQLLEPWVPPEQYYSKTFRVDEGDKDF